MTLAKSRMADEYLLAELVQRAQALLMDSAGKLPRELIQTSAVALAIDRAIEACEPDLESAIRELLEEAEDGRVFSKEITDTLKETLDKVPGGSIISRTIKSLFPSATGPKPLKINAKLGRGWIGIQMKGASEPELDPKHQTAEEEKDTSEQGAMGI